MIPISENPPALRRFAVLVLIAGVLLTLTLVPGVFTIDEDNYVVNVTALRQGRVTVPGTEGLPPSSELAWFDPTGDSRVIEDTPVASTAPPLYAPLALPFSYLGWRGLQFLNVLAFLLATFLVFAYARRYSVRAATPWWAASAFALGGYALEYAQGMWPHMLALSLTTAAAYGTARLRDTRKVRPVMLWAFAAGIAAGLAAGLRYQNILVAGLIGLGVLIWAPLRWRASLAYGLGVLLPVSASSFINHARFGSWNPISKGTGYLPSLNPIEKDLSFSVEMATMAWARIVDYSARPALTGTDHSVYLSPDSTTGAYLLGGVVKKAWFQSAPWLIIALLLLILVWAKRRPSYHVPWPRRQHREARALSLVVLPVLLMFAASGIGRTDGFSYNQRYFLELVPLAAIAFAWALERIPRHRRRKPPSVGPFTVRLLVGLGAGVLAALGAQFLPAPSRYYWVLYVPLALAALAGLVWALAVAAPMRQAPGRARSRMSIRTTVAIALAAAGIGWATTLHVQDDLLASRQMRRANAAQAAALGELLDDRPSALFAFWGQKDFVGPLLLHHDLMVFDLRNDRGEAAPRLLDAVLEQGRSVYVIPNALPPQWLGALVGDRAVRRLGSPVLNLVEIRDEPGDGPPDPRALERPFEEVPEGDEADPDGEVSQEEIEREMSQGQPMEIPPPVTDPVPSPP